MDPPELGGLLIEGELVFEEKNLNLVSRWVLIDGGSLIVGRSDSPYLGEATITLTGIDQAVQDDRVPAHMGSKFLGVINGGRLELHGERAEAVNWTQLVEHAFTGSSQLKVDSPVDWRTGDRLVIAPSGFDPYEAEEVTITSVLEAVIHFSPPLEHDHWGQLQTIGGHVIDERAEVACLTRNIVIQGDEASVASEFGGHLMFGPNATIHIEGIELRRMGQKGHAARYPIHWHLAGDRRGDYARGNSIHHSYHRGIVTHGSSNILVEGNVAYDVWSHTFVPSEDGSERGNQYIDNLGIFIRRLALADYTFPESAAGASFQSEGRPGIFWMRNPDHVLIGNHAAGVVNGMGFFYDGPSRDKTWTGTFTGNVAHSCSGPSGNAADRYPGLTMGYGLFMEDQKTPERITFRDFTAYKNSLSGIWLEASGQHALGAILADNGTGAILFQSTIEDSVIVGQSANTIGELPQVGISLTGGVQITSGPILKAPQLRNIDFIDQRDAGIVMLGTALHPLSALENLSFQSTQPCWIAEPDQLVGGFTDTDGSLLGDQVPVFIHGQEPLAVTDETIFDSTINAWVTPLAALQYLSLTDTNPMAEDVGFTVLARGETVGTLPDTSIGGQSVNRSGYLKKDSRYEMLRFDPLPDGVRISVKGDVPSYIVLEINRSASAFVYEETTSLLGVSVPNFENLAPMGNGSVDVINGTHSSWYNDTALKILFQRLETNGSVYVFEQPTGGLDFSVPETLWQYRQFGYHALMDYKQQALWGMLSDPDGDGLRNQLEYFLDTNPIQGDNPIVFDPERRLLTFPKNPKATDLDFIVSYSSDLATWYSDTEINISASPSEAHWITATVPEVYPNKSLFMKLQVKSSL